MENTRHLLNKLNIDNNKLIGVEIKKVEIDIISSILNIYISSNNLIKLDEYLLLFKMLKQQFNDFKNIKIFVSINEIDNKEIDLEELNKYIDLYIKKYDELLEIKDSIKVSIENNNIVFLVNNIFQSNLISNYEESIIEFINNIGISNMGISIKINEEAQLELENKINKTIETIEFEPTVSTNNVLFGLDLSNKKTDNIEDVLTEDFRNNYVVEGEIFNLEIRELTKCTLLICMLVDDTDAITIKSFNGFNNKSPQIGDFKKLKVGMKIKVAGKKEYDKYNDEETLMLNALTIIDPNPSITDREDTSIDKRVELHLHTKMSKNNGIDSLDSYMQLAKHFGHKGLAITDHDVVHGFVEGDFLSKKHDIKIVYGIESTVVKDNKIVLNKEEDIKLYKATYCVFDLETTGLSANFNEIIEFGAVLIKDGMIVDRYQSFVNINKKLKPFTIELTGIEDSDIENGIDIKEALTQFQEFAKGSILVAHNAMFDMQFLARNLEKHLNIELENPVIDTLELSRFINVDNVYHTLKILARKYGVELSANSHHRADYDAEKLTEIFVKMLEELKEKNITNLNEINKANNINKSRGNHNLIYVKNQKGLRDLYELISDANTVDFQREPRIKESKLLNNKENLIYVGGGCSKSEIVNLYLNASKKELEDQMSKFDYIELLSISEYTPLIKDDIFENEEQIKEMLIELYNIANKLNIKCLANGNVHYTEPSNYIAKEILYAKDFKPGKMKKNKVGVEEPIDKIKYTKWKEDNFDKNSNQYFKSTDEMKKEFDFFDEQIVEEIVVKNTNELFESTEKIKILPDELFTPSIDGVDEKLRNLVMDRANYLYGNDLPQIIIDRLEKELNSIINYGFAVIYYLSYKLVKYSLDAGYLVGSRGSIGSSLVATFMNITEINPLPPHYYCIECSHSEFFVNGEIASGYDLEDKSCPMCGKLYKKDGQDIPFETFLGFKGDKVPDIDLNFSGDFQTKAHEYIRSKDSIGDDELFDENHVFRAGTIGTVANKTAFAYTRNYFDLIEESKSKTSIAYYLRLCESIKRTTGQHPGGLIVVPKEYSIYDFTPIQYPADDKNSIWKTTHFDFNAIHDNLLKLDILGHDDPTMLKKLQDLTGVDPQTIDVADEKVLDLFTGTSSLGVTSEQILSKLGTRGIPEFGTDFVMGMLLDTKPKTFSELVQISGLSHGTDVWLGNAKELIDDGICELKDVIGCRDDIMVYLMHAGVEPLKAFNIMENVRKGKGLTQDEIALLKDYDIPDWYISSCLKIKYMFPKAHAAAYVLMALRIAYFKVYYPLEYYCAYFSSRVSDFEVLTMIKGSEKVRNKIKTLEEVDNEYSDIKKKNILNSLKMSLEMIERGFHFKGFDLNKSEASEFIIDEEGKGLYMPFNIIEGLGEKEAQNIIEQREIKFFTSKEDFKIRTKVKKGTYEKLEFFETLDGLSEENQGLLF